MLPPIKYEQHVRECFGLAWCRSSKERCPSEKRITFIGPWNKPEVRFVWGRYSYSFWVEKS